MATKEELLFEKRKLGLEETISKEEQALLDKGMPSQKIIGYVDLDDLKIWIERNVLIPRYETYEVIVEALQHITESSRVLDLCTGSGFIGLTIKQKTGARVLLSDIDFEATDQAKANAKKNKLDVTVVTSDMFKSIGGKYDVIISNPPYIPNKTKLDKSVTNFEPSTALFGGEDGNDFYKIIVKEGPEYLREDGWIICEISPDNAEYMESEGFKIIKDINGKARIAKRQYKKTQQ